MSDEIKEQENQEVVEEVKPKRGRPPKEKVSTVNQVEEMFQKLIDEVHQERPEAQLLNDKELNDHNKKLLRQIQIILDEDLRMMSAKNITRIATPNGIAKFEITGLTKEQREHLREMFKIIATSIKIFESSELPVDAKTPLQDLTKKLYRGIPGLIEK